MCIRIFFSPFSADPFSLHLMKFAKLLQFVQKNHPPQPHMAQLLQDDVS